MDGIASYYVTLLDLSFTLIRNFKGYNIPTENKSFYLERIRLYLNSLYKQSPFFFLSSCCDGIFVTQVFSDYNHYKL